MNKNQRIENGYQILRSVSEGDSRAFRTLYMHYYDRLFNFAMLFPHVAMVYDQTKCHFYANGKKVQDVDATGVPADMTSITFFNANTKNEHMMGQVRLWNKALTQAEIQSNMGGPVAVSSNLTGYWKMDEGEGDVVHDSSGNGNDATVVTGKIIEWRPEQCFTKTKSNN